MKPLGQAADSQLDCALQTKLEVACGYGSRDWRQEESSGHQRLCSRRQSAAASSVVPFGGGKCATQGRVSTRETRVMTHDYYAA